MKITVVTAVYNGEAYLESSINSILTQTYRNLKYIIVNDGSTDRTKSILDEIKDNRVRIIHLTKNQGAANALNLAIQKAKSDWIAIHDADDISLPLRLEEQSNYVKSNPDVIAVGAQVKSISGRKPIPEQNLLNVDEFYNSCVTRDELLNIRYERCPLCHGSVMFSKNAFLKAGGYNTEYKVAYDYDLWMRMFEIGAIDKLQKVLYQYRVHGSSLSHSNWEVMLNEKLRSSFAAIRRHYAAEPLPKFVVFGTNNNCTHLMNAIIPSSGIEVLRYFKYNNIEKKMVNASEMFKSNEINGIVVLDCPKKSRIKQYLLTQGMRMNFDLFLL